MSDSNCPVCGEWLMSCCGRGVLVGDICFKDECNKIWRNPAYQQARKTTEKVIEIFEKIIDMNEIIEEKFKEIDERLSAIENKL